MGRWYEREEEIMRRMDRQGRKEGRKEGWMDRW
jgi:hypothetical protein